MIYIVAYRKKAIDSKWIFKIEKDEDGNHLRYKARLVIKDCAQKKELDYKEIYPLLKLLLLEYYFR